MAGAAHRLGKCESVPRVDITIPSLALTQIDDEESENQVRCRQTRLLWVQGHLAAVALHWFFCLFWFEPTRETGDPPPEKGFLVYSFSGPNRNKEKNQCTIPTLINIHPIINVHATK